MSDAASQSDKPQVIARIGASYLRVKKAKQNEELKKVRKEESIGEHKRDSKRGRISRFSYKSRLNLIRTLSQVKRDNLPSFVTLTYAGFDVNPEQWKRDLYTFIKRLNRAFPEVAGIWKLEPQQRGAPHYHIMVWGASTEELQAFVPLAWYEIAGNGQVEHLMFHLGELQGGYGKKNENCVQAVKTPKAMYTYVAKYMSKDALEGWGNVGRWWGIFFRERLPLGEEVIFDVTDKKVIEIMRYFRRFAHIKSRNYSSLILVCDVNHWLEKLEQIPLASYKDWLSKY